SLRFFFFFFQAEDGIRDLIVTGVQTCALPISRIGGSNTSDARGTVVVRTDRPTITLRHVRGFANAPPVHWQIIINRGTPPWRARDRQRSEEHTSELQSRSDLVCRLLLEKKKE